jgi:hypothetical protein
MTLPAPHPRPDFDRPHPSFDIIPWPDSAGGGALQNPQQVWVSAALPAHGRPSVDAAVTRGCAASRADGEHSVVTIRNDRRAPPVRNIVTRQYRYPP